MKKMLMVGLIAVTMVTSSQAQWHHRGHHHHHHHHSGRGLGIGLGVGLGVGLLVGSIAANSHRNRYDYYSYESQPTYYSRPNYAVTGAVVGGIAGGVIGHNNGRHTAEGIAIGAGAGLLLGAVAESHARHNERVRASLQPTYVVTQPATVLTTTPIVTQAVAQPQNVTVVNNNYISSETPAPMSSANALFGR